MALNTRLARAYCQALSRISHKNEYIAEKAKGDEFDELQKKINTSFDIERQILDRLEDEIKISASLRRKIGEIESKISSGELAESARKRIFTSLKEHKGEIVELENRLNELEAMYKSLAGKHIVDKAYMNQIRRRIERSKQKIKELLPAKT